MESGCALTRHLIIGERDPVSDTRTRARGRSHVLPCARGSTHAPARAREELSRAATRQESGSRASSLSTRPHALKDWFMRTYAPGSNSTPNGKLTMSMVIDALFNEEARRREMGMIDQIESQALVSERSRERASEDGKSDWVLDSGSVYHLYRNREVFSTYALCEGRVWMANNTASRVVGRGPVPFRMADGRSVMLTEQEDWTRKATVAQRYAKQAYGYLEDPEWYKSAGRCFGICTEVWPDTSGATSLYAQGRRDGATTTRKVTYFAAHPGGRCGAP
ncbi:hypothetical protein Acr_18g0006670 [Actinidia rufa]|uniref:Retrovirus-related Pol polyprotein from transposon TNT 1-94-like beta-barrel domain-containing protein n=1 Tax=Actinidia rufa TaxID=165716 RepID=A0A7J0G6U6_9ERIC|nr:hypothetical protein Acr_18g0006670 [Actinidia rufa]